MAKGILSPNIFLTWAIVPCMGRQQCQYHDVCILQVLEQDDEASLSTAGAPHAECALSAAGSAASRGAWSPCESAPSYANLRDGTYTFMARTPSTSSNIAHQYAVSNFTVDISAPAIKVRVTQGAHSKCCVPACKAHAHHELFCREPCDHDACLKYNYMCHMPATPRTCQMGADACIVRKME